jgi:hypothetical protein
MPFVIVGTYGQKLGHVHGRAPGVYGEWRLRLWHVCVYVCVCVWWQTRACLRVL